MSAAKNKCPMCEGDCIVKIIATSDARWREVDVCKMCGEMYPRDRKVVGPAPEKPGKPRKRATPKTGKAKKRK